jgi:hypothetical protein
VDLIREIKVDQGRVNGWITVDKMGRACTYSTHMREEECIQGFGGKAARRKEIARKTYTFTFTFF